MTKFLYAIVVLLVLGVALIQGQVQKCSLHRLVLLRPGNRYCIPHCPPQRNKCITAVRPMQIRSCPEGCCLSPTGCIVFRRG